MPVNQSEKYLESLCRTTFLGLWCHSNLYRNQKWGSKKEGKELCDQTIIFGNHVILFSDKSIKFSKTININNAWNRWFKKAIISSARQLNGAVRWIQNFSEEVYEDSQCSIPLHIPFPDNNSIIFHRIAVARGASAPCAERYGGPGSLIIQPSLIDRDHYCVQSDENAFKVGIVGGKERFVHIFDDYAIEIVLKNVNTIKDFIRYLEQRKKLLLSHNSMIVEGEEELMGLYLQRLDNFGRHYFDIPEYQQIGIGGGIWRSWQSHPDRIVQQRADGISYIWDKLIEHFSKHLQDDTLVYGGGSGFSRSEKSLRIMASTSRFERRSLAKSIVAVCQNGSTCDTYVRVYAQPGSMDPVYVFVSLNPRVRKIDEEYRDLRREVLWGYCAVACLEYPGRQILGIAFVPANSVSSSEDILLIEPADQDDDYKACAKSLKEKLGLLQNAKSHSIEEFEFPRQQLSKIAKGRNRNKLCPCGSGKKVKHCCGRNYKY